jgi:hypothetical protein
MDLGVFELHEPAIRAWLEADGNRRLGAGWDPLELGSENDVLELLAPAQRQGLLTGPAEVAMIYLDDPNGDACYNPWELHQVGGFVQVACWECAPN